MQKMRSSFLMHYGLMLLLAAMVAVIAYAALDFSNSILSRTLVKTRFPAQSLLKPDYTQVDASGVKESGGGVQVVNESYQVVLSEGIPVFEKPALSAGEFTAFLAGSRAVGVPYSHDIAYSEAGKYWLIVSFPTSLRIDFSIARNTRYPSVDIQAVTGAVVATVILSLLLLSLAAVFSSRITALTVTRPLQKLCLGTRRLKEGDLSTRVDLKLKNEFLELQNTFNAMAEKLQEQTLLREQAEKSRRQLVLDISHDLKNPLAAILGYAEYGLAHLDGPVSEQERWLAAIQDNGQRANRLISGLFELSKLESPEYRLKKSRVDIGEYLRRIAARAISSLEEAGFAYEVDIPEAEIFACIDESAMDRVFQNLLANATAYNPLGTKVSLSLAKVKDAVEISFADNGIGMAQAFAQTVFEPFTRADAARNSASGGTGLGLSIVEKIIALHEGTIRLTTGPGKGCSFLIRLPAA